MGICFRRRRLDTFLAVAARRDAPAQHRSLARDRARQRGAKLFSDLILAARVQGQEGAPIEVRGIGSELDARGGLRCNGCSVGPRARRLFPVAFPLTPRTDISQPPVGRACPCAPTAGLSKPALHRMCDKSYAGEHWPLTPQTDISKASTMPERRRASRFSSPLFCPAPGMLSGPPPGATRASMLSP